MRISKILQKALAAMLVLSLFAASLAANPAQAFAAKSAKKNITLYLGENDVLYYAGAMVTKATSSSKKTVTANPEDALSYKVVLSAKKTGKATVTVNMPKGVTHKLAVTVKKPKFDTDLSLTGSGIVISSTNRMPQYFKTRVECTLRDAEGEVLWKKDIGFKQLPEKTYYFYWGQSSSLLEQVDLDQSTVEVTSFERFRLGASGPSDLRYVYKDVSDKIKSSVKVTPDEKAVVPTDNFEIKLKNPSSAHNVSVTVYLMFYDEDDNLLRLTRDTTLLAKKETETRTVRVSAKYDHYEMILYGVEGYFP